MPLHGRPPGPMRQAAATSRSPRRTALRVAVVGAAVALPLMVAAPMAAASTPPALVPDPGGQAVSAISVSPAYTKTGLVLATASKSCPGGASGNCNELWVSHDKGMSWQRVPATGWDGQPPLTVLDSAGKEILYAGGEHSLQRSTDGGQTWSVVGDAGTPVTMPGPDTVLVAAKPQDYILKGGKLDKQVTGSGQQTVRDIQFMPAPAYPSGGTFFPALLSAGDPQTGLPVIEQCTADLSCHGASSLPGAGQFSVPAVLHPSTKYGSDGVVFVQSGRGIYKSHDGGVNFAPLSIGEPGATGTATPALALAPGYSETGSSHTALVAVLQIFNDTKDPSRSHIDGGVYRSTDTGLSWTRLLTGWPDKSGAVAMALAPDGRIFASYSGAAGAGFACSLDSQTWRPNGCASRLPGSNAGGKQSSSKTSSTPCSATCSAQTAAANPSAAAGGSNGDAQSGGHLTPVGAAGAGHGSGGGGKGGLAIVGIVAAVVALLLGGAAVLRTRLRPAREEI